MAAITRTPDALADLDAITEYIAQDAPEYAPEFANKIVEAASHLAQIPHLGRRVAEVEGFREVVFGKYRIIYEPRGDNIWIMAVMHGAMDFGTFATQRWWNLS